MPETTHHNYTGVFFLFNSFFIRFISFLWFFCAFCFFYESAMVLCAQCRRIWRSYCFIYFIIFFSRRMWRYVLINSHSSKWNWSNGILKSDTLLPFHLFLFDMCTATWTVHPVGGVYGDRERERGTHMRSYWLCAVHSTFLPTSRFVDTFRRYLWTRRMCVVSHSYSHRTGP